MTKSFSNPRHMVTASGGFRSFSYCGAIRPRQMRDLDASTKAIGVLPVPDSRISSDSLPLAGNSQLDLSFMTDRPQHPTHLDSSPSGNETL